MNTLLYYIIYYIIIYYNNHTCNEFNLAILRTQHTSLVWLYNNCMSRLTIRDLDLKICQTIKYPNLATPITTKDSPRDAYHAPTLRLLRCRLPSGKKCPFTDDLRIENGYFLSITLSNYQRVPSSQISGCKEKPHKFTRLISNNISTRLRSSKSQVSTGPTTSSQLDAQAHPQVPHSIHWLFIMFPNI